MYTDALSCIKHSFENTKTGMFCLRKTAEFRLRETSTFVAILFSLTTVEMVRFELMTPCLPDKCSPSELHPRFLMTAIRIDIFPDISTSNSEQFRG